MINNTIINSYFSANIFFFPFEAIIMNIFHQYQSNVPYSSSNFCIKPMAYPQHKMKI